MSNKKFNSYVNNVLKYINTNVNTKKKIKEDLLITLENKSQELREEDPIKLLGNPKDVAKEFMENININYNNLPSYEYISETKIFGIPLVHINYNNFGLGKAKGIIAIGKISIGVISLGGISFGVFSFGGLSLGLLLSFGGFAGSLGIALGGLALAYNFAIGGLAIAKDLAIGGYASANIAFGGQIKAIVGTYKQSGTGQFIYKFNSENQKVLSIIKSMYPNIGKLKMWIISSLLS